MELATITGELASLRATWRWGNNPENKQIIVSFDNGYGASIIEGPWTYGVELAVLNEFGHITFDTPITDDVLGYLTPETLKAALIAIASLPART